MLYVHAASLSLRPAPNAYYSDIRTSQLRRKKLADAEKVAPSSPKNFCPINPAVELSKKTWLGAMLLQLLFLSVAMASVAIIDQLVCCAHVPCKWQWWGVRGGLMDHHDAWCVERRRFYFFTLSACLFFIQFERSKGYHFK